MSQKRPSQCLSWTQQSIRKRQRSSLQQIGLELNFLGVSWYLGFYIGPREELEAWVKPQVGAWAHGVRVLSKISKCNPQSDYAGLGVQLKLEW